jgi:acyl dehydratase
MNPLDFDAITVGDQIPPITTEPVSRTTLALYCGASGDHNPLHVDVDFARRAGFDDVIAHGMLSMAYLARAVTNWASIDRLRSYAVRFSTMTQVNDVVSCTGCVAEKFVVDGEKRVRLALEAQNRSGEVTVAGEAVVAV